MALLLNQNQPNPFDGQTLIPFTISEPGPDVSVINIVPSYCEQGSGSADSEVSGGTEPYSYLWSGTPSQTNPNATGLPPGNYTLRVKDANGCREVVSFTVTNNSPITLTTSLVNAVSCNGGSDGSTTVTVTGGGLPIRTAGTRIPCRPPRPPQGFRQATASSP